MIIKGTKYAYNDLYIRPAAVSNITSRKECDVHYPDGMLPIFASPMSCVVNTNNLDNWTENKITPIIPRNIDLLIRERFALKGHWIALGEKEFYCLFISDNKWVLDFAAVNKFVTIKVCIDIANGHMKSVLESIKKAKTLMNINGVKLVVMYGNVANPESYIDYARYGVDYIRCGIGSGYCCITASNTAVHYPQASLIDEVYQKKIWVEQHERDFLSVPMIVADGGIKNFDNAIVALALGADYVMIGSLFGGFYESASPFNEKSKISKWCDVVTINADRQSELFQDNNVYPDGNFYTKFEYEFKLDELDEAHKREILRICDLTKNIWGMSTHKAQQEIDANKALKTSEGIERTVHCKYTTKQWTDNFVDSLRSAMSYTNSDSLFDFIGRQVLVCGSSAEQYAVND